MNENMNKKVNYNIRCQRGFYKGRFVKKKVEERREKLFQSAMKSRAVSSANENKVRLYLLFEIKFVYTSVCI